MARGVDSRRIHDRRFRARSASPPPADGGAGAISQAARISAAGVAAAPVRGCSVPPRRGDGEVSSRPQLESLRIASLMEQPQAKKLHPELRQLVSSAMARMNRATPIDDTVLDEFLQQLSDALLKADFSSWMVSELRSKIKSTVDLAASGSKCALQQAIIKQLCRLVDSGQKPGFIPKKGKPCVILVIGLQGAGKCASSAKFAYYHQQRGHSPSLVCADTRGRQAFDRLKQIARESNIPCYGSYTESDPATVAAQGVEKFKKENSDLIVIKCGGSHVSEDALVSEICRVDKATKPDLVVLVIDAASGGRSALNQAQIFKRKVAVGSVIVTKMDAHMTGGGTLNALAVAKLPVIFLGTGKRIQEYQMFDVKLFSTNLLDHKGRHISIDTEDLHRIFDNLKLSENLRRSAMHEVEVECCNAYSSVFERHKLLVHQICSLESKYKRLCDALGEKELEHADIQSATSLKERRALLLVQIKRLEKERDTRTKKMETRLQDQEVKKAEQVDKSRHDILRQGQMYVRGETKDRGGLKELIRMTVEWEAKHMKVLRYEKKSLLDQLLKIDSESPSKSDTSRQAYANKTDTEMVHSTSSSSRSDTEMGQSSTSSGTRSDSNDPDYSPESTESDIEMGHLVVSEPSSDSERSD